MDAVASYNCKLCDKRDFLAKREFLVHVKEVHQIDFLKDESFTENDGPKEDGRICKETSDKSDEARPIKQEEETVIWDVAPENPGKGVKSEGHEISAVKNPLEIPADKAPKGPVPTSSLVFTMKDTKDHVCSECGKAFTWQSALKRHVDSIHLGLKQPQKCSVCGRGFTRAEDLRRHAGVVHKMGETNHVCKFCGKVCARPSELVEHANAVHLGVKPHECKKCGAAFAHKSRLKVHLKRCQKETTLRHDKDGQLVIKDEP